MLAQSDPKYVFITQKSVLNITTPITCFSATIRQHFFRTLNFLQTIYYASNEQRTLFELFLLFLAFSDVVKSLDFVGNNKFLSFNRKSKQLLETVVPHARVTVVVRADFL